jgi:hypothetical protein
MAANTPPCEILSKYIHQSEHYDRLSLFLNATEDTLVKSLKPIEEFNGNEGFFVGDYCTSPLGGFHPEAVRMVLRDDGYFLSLRANHFVLIFGQSEVLHNGIDWDDCVVCLANHKGGLCIHVFQFINGEAHDA